uniref:Uncharacterized protein n=1 Tax=Strongyloides venezuelensis TaxID=75913 RepID=A0A0K0FIQ4_STRVS
MWNTEMYYKCGSIRYGSHPIFTPSTIFKNTRKRDGVHQHILKVIKRVSYEYLFLNHKIQMIMLRINVIDLSVQLAVRHSVHLVHKSSKNNAIKDITETNNNVVIMEGKKVNISIIRLFNVINGFQNLET